MMNSPETFEMLPEKIKLEILKEEFLKTYNKEVQLEKTIINHGYEKNDYINSLFFGRDEALKILNSNLTESYKDLFYLLNTFKLSEEGKTQIYYWAKTKRKELELNDNLFNIFPYILSDKYEKINEQISKQNSI